MKSDSGKLVEEVYRAGTPDGKIPAGRYAQFLKKANEYLEKAQAYAEPGQDQAIAALIRYYQTGDPADWIRFGTAWVQNNARVDFANGFIEVYRDARAAKGTAQSFVSITDEKLNQPMVKLAANAQYFEDRAPWVAAIQETGRQAAHGQGRRDGDRDRRFSREHHRRQPAQRERNPREVRQQELPVYGQLAHLAPAARGWGRWKNSRRRRKRSPPARSTARSRRP